MTSGYVYEPLRKIRVAGTSGELHIADMVLTSKFGFDEFVRVCASASNADSIEISAVSDIYRLYLLSFIKAPFVSPMITAADIQGLDTPRLGEAKEAEEDEEEEKGQEDEEEEEEDGRHKPNMTLVNQTLKLTLLRYIDELEEIEKIKDKAARAAAHRQFYAKVGAVMYAHQLLTNDRAVMPTDNVYNVNGNLVRVPRPSKLAAYIGPVLQHRVPLVELNLNYIPYVSEQNGNYYVKMIAALRERIQTLDSNKALTLTPATDILFMRYQTTFQMVKKTMTVLWNLFSSENGPPPDFIKFDSLVNRVNETEAIPQLLLTSEPETLSETLVDQYMNDLTHLVSVDGNKQKAQAKILFDKLLHGDYLDGIDHKALPYKPTELTARYSLDDTYRLCSVTVNYSGGRSMKVLVLFQRVDPLFNTMIPSVMVPEFLPFKSLTIPFAANSNRQLGRHGLLEDAYRETITKLYVDYVTDSVLATPNGETLDEKSDQFIKNRFSDNVTEIYGDETNTYNPRAGRVAFQGDALYFHFLEKYRIRRYVADTQYDWVGRVIFPTDAFEPIVGFMGAADRPYTIRQNQSINLKRTHFTGAGSVKAARNELRNQDNLRFNANIKRELIIARAAEAAFKNDPNAKIWLGFQEDMIINDLNVIQPVLQDQPVTGFWSAFRKRIGLSQTLKPSEAIVNLEMVKEFGGKVPRSTMEKDVTIVAVTDLDHYVTPSGRPLYHTEYVVFHNKPMINKQVAEYARHLTQQVRAPRKSAAKGTLLKDEDEELFKDDDDEEKTEELPRATLPADVEGIDFDD